MIGLASFTPGSTMSTSVKPNDTSTLTTSLRSSCDRCRAQKLRCVPSSQADPSAPCQRCLRGKEPKSCTFSRRLQTGKPPASGRRSDHRQNPRRENHVPTKFLPGMNTFTLSSLSSPEPSIVEKSRPETATSSDKSQSLESEAFLDSLWSDEYTTFIEPALQTHINTVAHVHEPPSHAEECEKPDSGEMMDMHADPSFQSDLVELLDVQQILASPPYTASPQLGLDFDTNMAMGMDILEEETPGLLVDLSGLLGKLSHYEMELAKLYESTLDNYPIGDALYLSQRFHVILINHGRIPTFDNSSDIDMPTRLLSLSCYILLTRIYLTIFKYLYAHLSQLPAALSNRDLGPSSYSIEYNMDAYRGLRLGQLQSISVGWEPAMRIRKAMSMLLNSLGNSERALGLPATVRTALHTEKSQEDADGSATESVPLFEEGGVLAPLMNGRLQKKLREQERNLRAKVEDVDDLLDGLLAPSK
ncbi:hypothetical protein N7532_009003 [Penicillium argentinense]|uniref:Zn(2)-C6 fungal-type domain-containing protein n=1 Tax=Penicillium argentinense TaxID=1131581 RepID=A0A9W9EYF7_9EURO|nr:uncharacterized protein N7532_009003 [Penicillium argentinense]KAJ5090319.1 hypothetical protein N7532_009003 [Penicillium argentinense]